MHRGAHCALALSVFLTGAGCADDGTAGAAVTADAGSQAEPAASAAPRVLTPADFGPMRPPIAPPPVDRPPESCQPPLDACADIPRLAGSTRYPIVLVHGMGGFGSIGILDYWLGVERALRDAGVAVYTAVVDPMNGSDVRGGQLAAFIDRVLACTCAGKVNLVAHSQGGIDGRYAVNVLGYGDRVASISTISTPHAGSGVADVVLALTPGAADPLVDLVAWLATEAYADPLEDPHVRSALLWTSRSHLAWFSEAWPDDERVARYSYAGRAGMLGDGKPECEDADLPNPAVRAPMHAALMPGWVALGGPSGVDGDGLVTVDAARWGHFRGCIPADHMQEVGYFIGVWPVFDHLGFYLSLAHHLGEAGH